MDTKNTANPQGDTSDISYQVMPRSDGQFTPEPETVPRASAPSPLPPKAPVAPTSNGVTPPVPPTSEPPVLSELDHSAPPSIWHNSWLYIIIGAVLLVVIGGAIYLMSQGDDSDKTPSENPETTTRVPKVWLQQYFNKEVCDDQSVCGDDADPDSDGLANYDEFKTGTSPISSDSDTDGLADGDEVHVYKTDPILKFTDRREIAQTSNWTDGVEIQGGYDPLTPGRLFTETRLAQIKTDIQTHQLNEPTMTTLNVSANGEPKITETTPPPSSVAPKTVAITIEANKINPSEITINLGDSVVWLNKDSVTRVIASDPHPSHTALPELVSPNLTANQTYSFKFTQAGTWGYHDHNNPTLKGTVIVK